MSWEGQEGGRTQTAGTGTPRHPRAGCPKGTPDDGLQGCGGGIMDGAAAPCTQGHLVPIDKTGISPSLVLGCLMYTKTVI